MMTSDKNCIFCAIVERKIPTAILGENNSAIAILDAFPVEAGHSLIVSKKCTPDISGLDNQELWETTKLLQQTVDKLKTRLKLKDFNILSNSGELAGQKIFHFHVHIVPKIEKDVGLIIVNKAAVKKLSVKEVKKLVKD